uniref:Rho GDP-dissociation inhibitor 3 n=1 Tax=Plectus sambesii TaxID=2011161 RepID=A0A914VAL8_9BILA
MAEATSPVEISEAYRAPAQKSVSEILAADAEDESLRRYKEALLGGGVAASVVLEPNNPKNVLVRSLTLVVEGRPDEKMDLSKMEDLSGQTFAIKEGCHYRLRIEFHVQREIVAGMKYVQKVYRAGVPVDKDEFMVGSYPPKNDLQSYTTPVEEAPHGMLHRGKYKVKSLFTDDDKHEWLAWEWSLEIKKDWN